MRCCLRNTHASLGCARVALMLVGMCTSAQADSEQARAPDDAASVAETARDDLARQLQSSLLVNDERTRTFVSRLVAVDLSPSLADTLSDVIVGVYAEDASRQVLGPRDVAAVLDWQAAEALLGCNDDCASEIGAALDAERLVVSNARLVGREVFVSLRELDLTTGEPRASVDNVLPVDDMRALVYGIRRLALRAREAATSMRDVAQLGTLSIETEEPGALVTIDGTPMGSTPLTTSSLRPGLRGVRIEQEGARAEFMVPVVTAELTTVHVEIVKTKPSFAQMAAHDALVRTETVAGVGKLACGVAYGCAGVGCLGLAFAGVQNEWLFTLENLVPVFFGIAAGCVPATALLTWGASDLASLPDEPQSPVPVHRVTVTPPAEHGRTRIFNVRDTRDGGFAF
jgi:hypothetical protein